MSSMRRRVPSSIRWVVGVATTGALLVAGCGETVPEEPTPGEEPAEQPSDESAEEIPSDDPDGSALRVFVFAENPAEKGYYEALGSSFEAETGVVVDLEVRLP